MSSSAVIYSSNMCFNSINNRPYNVLLDSQSVRESESFTKVMIKTAVSGLSCRIVL
jgi:hypothetical protein